MEPSTNKTNRPAFVILDTNFFQLIPVFKKDIFTDITEVAGPCVFIVSDKIKAELEGLAYKDRRARLALSVLNNCVSSKKIKLEKGTWPVDAWIVECATSLKERCEKVYVCTNDAALRKELKSKGIKVISLRGYSKIEAV